MSLFDQVVNESYNYDGSVDATIEAEINDRVSESVETMIEYVGECQMGMLALEAAIYAAEGHQAVSYLTAREADDQATMESVQVAMEGMIGDAWEKLKEWVKKAYAAIKAFVLKYWNKLKGYVDVFKGMIGKYSDVLRDKSIDIQVEWADVHIEEAAQKYSGIISSLKSEIEAFTKGTGKEKVKSELNQSVDDYKKAIYSVLYGDSYATNGIKTDKVSFASKRREILDAAEIGNAKKYIDFITKLNDNSVTDSVKAIDNAKKTTDSFEEKAEKSEEKKTLNSDKLTMMRKVLNQMIAVNKMGSNALTSAASLKIKLAVKACRAAIMATRTGEGKGEEKNENMESTGIDGILATIM